VTGAAPRGRDFGAGARARRLIGREPHATDGPRYPRGRANATRIECVDELGRIWLALSTRSLAADLGVTQRRVRECLEELCAARLVARVLCRVEGAGRQSEQLLRVLVAVPERDGL
jgi:hypothetical protein